MSSGATPEEVAILHRVYDDLMKLRPHIALSRVAEYLGCMAAGLASSPEAKEELLKELALAMQCGVAHIENQAVRRQYDHPAAAEIAARLRL